MQHQLQQGQSMYRLKMNIKKPTRYQCCGAGGAVIKLPPGAGVVNKLQLPLQIWLRILTKFSKT
jgi:hypothetical protein